MKAWINQTWRMNFKSSTSCRTGFHSTSAPHQLHPPPLLPPRPRPPVSATQNLRNLSVICCLLIGCSYHERDVALKHWSNSPHVCVILYVFDDELVFSISYMVSACHLFCCRSTFCAQRSAAPTSMKFIYIYILYVMKIYTFRSIKFNTHQIRDS